MIDVFMFICKIVIVVSFMKSLWFLIALHIHTLDVGVMRKWGCWRCSCEHDVHDVLIMMVMLLWIMMFMISYYVNKIGKKKRWCAYFAYMHLFICLDILLCFMFYFWFLKRIGVLIALWNIVEPCESKVCSNLSLMITVLSVCLWGHIIWYCASL